MAQKKFAISIKGGAAKGLAAIGVMRVFQEESLQPDIIAGSSAGAIIATMYAVGMKWFEMTKFVSQLKARSMISLKSIVRSASFIDEQRVMEIFGGYFDINMRLEDLPIKVVIFASDPRHNTRVFITKGNLVTALMASMAYPIILPSPILHGGQVLVDGDLTSSYSTSYLKEQGVAKVIGIRGQSDITALRKGANYAHKVNTIYSMLQGGVGVNADLADPCDLEIVFNPKGQSLLNFSSVEATVDKVYEQAVKFKPEIFKTLGIQK